jgi:plasmid stabilization system protein ParE
MARSVSWTETAWADLEAIADYIAQDSRFYAAAFVREVREAARSLRTLSERGRVVPEMSLTWPPGVGPVERRVLRLGWSQGADAQEEAAAEAPRGPS